MPDPALLTPMGLRLLSMIPAPLQESPDYIALHHVIGRELERLEGKIQLVFAQFNPMTADDTLLRMWEVLLRVPIAPPITLEERRSIVISMIRKIRSNPSGSAWEEAVTALIGPGWTYAEHDPSDPASPPSYTLRITLPLEPTDMNYGLVLSLLRVITPAHLSIVLESASGFRFDISEMDVQGLTF